MARSADLRTALPIYGWCICLSVVWCRCRFFKNMLYPDIPIALSQVGPLLRPTDPRPGQRFTSHFHYLLLL